MGRKKKNSEDEASQPDKESAGSGNIELGGIEALDERRMDMGTSSKRHNESIGIDGIDKEQCDGKHNGERKSLKDYDHKMRLFGRRRSPSKSPTRRDSRKRGVQETEEKNAPVSTERQGKNSSSSERMSRKDMFYADTSKPRIRESHTEKGDQHKVTATVDSSDEEIRRGKIGRERQSRRDFVNSTKCRRRLLSRSPFRVAKRCPLSSCWEKEKSEKKNDTPVELKLLPQKDTEAQQTKYNQSGSEGELKMEQNSNYRFTKDRSVFKRQRKRRVGKTKGTKDERNVNGESQRQEKPRSKKISLKCCRRKGKQSTDSQGSDSNEDDKLHSSDQKPTPREKNELNPVSLKSKSKHVNLSKEKSLDISVDDTVGLNLCADEPAVEDTETYRSAVVNSGQGESKSAKLNLFPDKPTLEDEENDSSVLVTCGDDIINSPELNSFNKETGRSTPATRGDGTTIITEHKESTSDETKTAVNYKTVERMERISDRSKTADFIKPEDQTESYSNQSDTVYNDKTEKQIDTVSYDSKLVENDRSWKQMETICDKTKSVDDGEPLEEKGDDLNRTETEDKNAPRIQTQGYSHQTITATNNDIEELSEVNSDYNKTGGDDETVDQTAANSDNDKSEDNDMSRQQHYLFSDTANNDKPGDDNQDDYPEHLNPFADDEITESENEISEEQQQSDRIDPCAGKSLEVTVFEGRSLTVLVENNTDETVKNSRVRSRWSILTAKRHRLSKKNKSSITEVAKRPKLAEKGSSSGKDTVKTSDKSEKLSRKWRIYLQKLMVRRHKKSKHPEKVNTHSEGTSDKDTQETSVTLLTTSKADWIPGGTGKRIKTWRARVNARKRKCSGQNNKKTTEHQTDSADQVTISKTAKKRRWFKVRRKPKCRADRRNKMDNHKSNSADQLSILKVGKKGHWFKLSRKKKNLKQEKIAVLERNKSEITGDDKVEVKSKNHQELNPMTGQIKSSLKDRPVPKLHLAGISDIKTKQRRWWKFGKRQRSHDTGKSEMVKDGLVVDSAGENGTDSPKKKRSILKRFKKALKPSKSKASSESTRVICDSTPDNNKKSSVEIHYQVKIKSDKMAPKSLSKEVAGRSKLTSTMAKLRKGWMRFNQPNKLT